jgi:hypothetical protein
MSRIPDIQRKIVQHFEGEPPTDAPPRMCWQDRDMYVYVRNKRELLNGAQYHTNVVASIEVKDNL